MQNTVQFQINGRDVDDDLHVVLHRAGTTDVASETRGVTYLRRLATDK